MRPRSVRIAIIGAGPKAAALAAKASVLNRMRFGSVRPIRFHIDVFDPNGVAANWRGEYGYTDGLQRLCTLIERDLGFPYTSPLASRIEELARIKMTAARAEQAELNLDGFDTGTDPGVPRRGSLIDLEMMRRFSWQAFQCHELGYARWIDSGRKPPAHSTFARYIEWALGRSGATLTNSRVSALSAAGNKWMLHTTDEDGDIEYGPYDGIVSTGPGPARSLHPGRTFGGRLFTGESFWRRLTEVRRLLADNSTSIAVLGGGGTGAAILAWFARSGYADKDITLIGDQATLYSRVDNWFESKMFSDSSAWMNLSRDSQRDFFQRVNRGVVWSNVVDEVERLERLTILDGRATRIEPAGPELEVHMTAAVVKQVTAKVVIDATGFDAWSFCDLLPSGFTKPSSKKEASDLQDKMQPDLSWHGEAEWPFPRLHVPGLSDKYGPGLGSLMSLGSMADKVLDAYLT